MRPLLDRLADANRRKPLAEICRPEELSDFIGQNHILGPGKPLRNLYENKSLASLLFWGPPGVGKTTLARILANNSDAFFVTLSAVSSGVADLRKVVQEANDRLITNGQSTLLFIDEIHRYSKTQQDALLPYVEDGTLTLIGATTENPSFQVIPALCSRLLLVKLQSLERQQIIDLIDRATSKIPESLCFDANAKGFIADYANGDGRSAINLLDVAIQCAGRMDDQKFISVNLLEDLAQQAKLLYDRQGDEHYDHASAYQKSMRGSDPNAAIYWLAKMIACGEDPRFIARRLLVTASEDVGNADPLALILANQAFDAVERLGLPEARIILAQATIYVARAPKSNASICAIDLALSDIQKKGHAYGVPAHLKDSHYKEAESYGHGVGYLYSHEHPDLKQEFLPQPIAEVCYVKPDKDSE